MPLPWVGSPSSQPLASRCAPRSTSPRSMPKSWPACAPRVASPEAFRAAGLEYNPALNGIQITLERRTDGRHFLRLSSQRPVNEPFVDLILEDQLVVGPHRARLHDAVRPAEPAPERASRSLRRCPATGACAAGAAGRPRPCGSRPPPQRPLPRRCRTARRAPRRAGTDSRRRQPPPATASRSPCKAGDTRRQDRRQRTSRPNVSLDQMLVAMLRANPEAFIGGNVNRLKAGAVLEMPTDEQAGLVPAGEARQTIIAQSRDFNEFRRRLAEGLPATGVGAGRPPGLGQGHRPRSKRRRPPPPRPTSSRCPRAPSRARPPRTRSPASAPPRKPPRAWPNSTRTSATSTSSASPPLRQQPLPAGSRERRQARRGRADRVRRARSSLSQRPPMAAPAPARGRRCGPRAHLSSLRSRTAARRGGYCPRYRRVRRSLGQSGRGTGLRSAAAATSAALPASAAASAPQPQRPQPRRPQRPRRLPRAAGRSRAWSTTCWKIQSFPRPLAAILALLLGFGFYRAQQRKKSTPGRQLFPGKPPAARFVLRRQRRPAHRHQ